MIKSNDDSETPFDYFVAFYLLMYYQTFAHKLDYLVFSDKDDKP